MEVKTVPTVGWTRKSARSSLLAAVDAHRKAVAERVTVLRDAQGLNQEDLAHKAGVSVKTVSRVENAKHDLRRDTLKKLAKALGVPLRDIQGELPAPLGLGATDPLQDQLDRIEATLKELVGRFDAFDQQTWAQPLAGPDQQPQQADQRPAEGTDASQDPSA